MTFFLLVPYNESIADYLDRVTTGESFHLNTADAARFIDEENPQHLYKVEIHDAGLTKTQMRTLRRAAMRDTEEQEQQ
jgi:hypothetical protein